MMDTYRVQPIEINFIKAIQYFSISDTLDKIPSIRFLQFSPTRNKKGDMEASCLSKLTTCGKFLFQKAKSIAHSSVELKGDLWGIVRI